MFKNKVHVHKINNKKKGLETFAPIIFTSEFLFGLPFGFSAYLNAKFRTIAKWFSFAVTIWQIMVSLVVVIQGYFELFSSLYFVEYFSIFLAVKSLDYSLCDFIVEIQTALGPVPREGFILSVYSSVVVILKFVGNCIQCQLSTMDYCLNQEIPYYFYAYTWFLISADFVSSALATVFYYVSHELKMINLKLQSCEVTPEQFLQRFIQIVNCYNKIKPLVNRLIILSLSFGVPKILFTLWFILTRIKFDQNQNWNTWIAEPLFLGHLVLHFVIPAVAAETIDTQTDATILILSHGIAQQTDEAKGRKATRVLHYVEKRPLRHEVLGVVPLGNHLPIAIFSFSCSYFIVFVQFAHLDQ